MFSHRLSFSSRDPFFRGFEPALSLLRGLERDLSFGPPVGRAPRPLAVQVTEGDEGWTLTADVPGVTEDGLSVTVEDGHLTLEATRTVEVPEGYEATRSERPELTVSRTFRLPRTVDPEAITARLAHGVLTVTLAKREAARPRTITVEAG